MSPPDAHEVAGVLVWSSIYVVGNLKENFKSDTLNEVQLWYSIYMTCIMYTFVCVLQSADIEYTCP